MQSQEIEALWRFWNVGSVWFGCRTTGEQVRAGHRAAALTKAGWVEEDLRCQEHMVFQYLLG